MWHTHDTGGSVLHTTAPPEECEECQQLRRVAEAQQPRDRDARVAELEHEVAELKARLDAEDREGE